MFTDHCLDEALGNGAVRTPKGRGRIDRMFRPGWLEWGFTRSPWWSPYALYLPWLAVLIGWRFWARPELQAVGLGVAVLAAVAGVLWWTFFEYWLHRWAFHFPPTTDVRKVVTYVIHRHHHIDPDVSQRLAATPLQSASVLVPFALVAYVLRPGDDLWLWFTVGTVAGYLLYELAHYGAHHTVPRTPWGRAIRRHHLRHHFKDSGRNFGISSPLWDFVFRTRAL